MKGSEYLPCGISALVETAGCIYNLIKNGTNGLSCYLSLSHSHSPLFSRPTRDDPKKAGQFYSVVSLVIIICRVRALSPSRYMLCCLALAVLASGDM
jgi:hypothetical protein